MEYGKAIKYLILFTALVSIGAAIKCVTCVGSGSSTTCPENGKSLASSECSSSYKFCRKTKSQITLLGSTSYTFTRSCALTCTESKTGANAGGLVGGGVETFCCNKDNADGTACNSTGRILPGISALVLSAILAFFRL